MKITYFPNESRGKGDHGWLASRFSFSFADYYDPNRMSFGALRVLNDDKIAPGAGFPPHSHQDMEIFTIPLKGKLKHADSTGKESVVGPGEIQIMSAGSGVTHSEFNDSDTEALELLQIWIEPNEYGIAPRHEEKKFSFLKEKNKLHEIINPSGTEGALRIRQNAYVSIGTFEKDQPIDYSMHDSKNGLFLFLIEGEAAVENQKLFARDALEIVGTDQVLIHTQTDAMILCIEVAME
jgi:redox-sensitive bicupin YhaK (pirin superfamily)